MVLPLFCHRYVFDNYTWDREGPEISSWNGHSIPARIPLSALISGMYIAVTALPVPAENIPGPIIGGPMHDKDVPRAVSREYYFSVCPESERVVLDTRKIQETLAADATVSQIVARWVTELHSIDSPCVELARNSPALFDYGCVFFILETPEGAETTAGSQTQNASSTCFRPSPNRRFCPISAGPL
jgi:hypothetical protein